MGQNCIRRYYDFFQTSGDKKSAFFSFAKSFKAKCSGFIRGFFLLMTNVHLDKHQATIDSKTRRAWMRGKTRISNLNFFSRRLRKRTKVFHRWITSISLPGTFRFLVTTDKTILSSHLQSGWKERSGGWRERMKTSQVWLVMRLVLEKNLLLFYFDATHLWWNAFTFHRTILISLLKIKLDPNYIWE